ncbi:MAG TPA: sugar ABC transporter permease [Ruminiclostridium sp.]
MNKPDVLNGMRTFKIKSARRATANKNLWGYFFILPAIIGLIVFQFGPILYSMVISFTQWDIITPMNFLGTSNYTRMVNDPLVWKSISVTLYYTILNVPLTLIITLLIAVLLDTKMKGMSLFRTIYYIPSIVPAVANAALWMFLYNPMYGFFNQILSMVGIQPQEWIYGEKQVIPSIVLMSIWGAGNTVIIYLAGLQGISRQLYEAIEIDGGGLLHKFFKITVPMISPIIFYNMAMGIIGSMQVFTQAFIMTDGGPANASMFYMLLLYRTAFKNQEMGYASAMAWMMFLIIGIITFITFKTSSLWVFYEGDDSK